MLGSEESFTTEDLDPIQGIYITNITASTFASLDGVTVAFTIVDNGIVDNSSNPRVYKPLIKIKNRLDAAYFSTGEPFFFGGDGPNARYYDDKDIVRDAPNYSAATDAEGKSDRFKSLLNPNLLNCFWAMRYMGCLLLLFMV